MSGDNLLGFTKDLLKDHISTGKLFRIHLRSNNRPVASNGAKYLWVCFSTLDVESGSFSPTSTTHVLAEDTSCACVCVCVCCVCVYVCERGSECCLRRYGTAPCSTSFCTDVFVRRKKSPRRLGDQPLSTTSR
jgi:hypothetical protein